jgi:hypothetical protein
MRVVLAFIAAVIVSYIVAVLFYTQLNLGNLVEMGIAVGAGDRFSAALHDLGGMTGLYLPIIAVALLIAFLVTRLILHWVPQLHMLGYVLAGFAAIFAVDFALGMAFGTHPIPVTRTTVGLISQCVAGALGGYVFALLTRKPAA